MTQSLQVLVVAPALPPTIGGAETIAEVLTLGLCRRADTRVHLLTSEAPRPVVEQALSRNGGTLTLVPNELRARDGFVGWEWATFARAEAIYRICAEQRIDVVHAMSHDTCLAAGIALAGTELKGKYRHSSPPTRRCRRRTRRSEERGRLMCTGSR